MVEVALWEARVSNRLNQGTPRPIRDAHRTPTYSTILINAYTKGKRPSRNSKRAVRVVGVGESCETQWQ